jgi:hypothetical protein
VVHSREPLGPLWVNQVDHLDRVQVVHPDKLAAAELRVFPTHISLFGALWNMPHSSLC